MPPQPNEVGRKRMNGSTSLIRQIAGYALLALGLVFFNAAHAQLSPEIQKGLNWLQAQVQANGSLAAETASVATAHQNRSETQTALKRLATPSTVLSNALSSEQVNSTEDIARTLIAFAQTGQDSGAALAELSARQNMDGGFGADTGHTSNPLDTAWALLAIKAANAPGNLSAALNYLKSAQAIDGSYLAADRADPYTSALALRALAVYSSQYALDTNIQATVTYLQTQQAVAGNWGDSPFLSAQAYIALHDFIPLAPTAPALSTYLLSRQLADGSWSGDPYVTALALQALSMTGSLPANPGLSILRGKVVDAQTGLPLSGVTATLSGGASASQQTGTDGVFEYRDLPPGDHALQLSLANYATVNATTLTRAGQTQDMGVLRMSKAAGATTGTIQGKVTDVANGQALSGATVSANGVISATTDAAGQYQISNIPAGDVTLEITAAGYAPATATGQLSAGGLMVFSPALTATGGAPDVTASLQGIVTSAASGQPLAGVAVTVSGSNALTTTTDSQGKYKLTGLTSGAITITAALSGYDTVSAEATVSPRSSTTFSPKMYPISTTPPDANTAGVTGIVMDAGSNAPLANVSINASYNGIAQTIQTGPDGRFSLNGITSARVELQFSLTGYQATAVTAALIPLNILDIGQIRLRQDKAVTLLPDLTIKTANRQGAITDQQSLAVSGSINATLANIGAANAPAGAQVLAFQDINRNGAFDAAVDVALGQLALPGEFAVGAAMQVQIPVQGTLTFRDAPIHLWVDSARSVAELKENNNVGSTAMGAEIRPDIGSFNPRLKWEWTGGIDLPGSNQVMMTPIVVPLQDTNHDGKIDAKDDPAIVFNTFDTSGAGSALRAISGKDGHELWTVTGHDIVAWASIAAGDLDGDGKVEIIAGSGDYLAAFDNNGRFLWNTPQSAPTPLIEGGLSIADLDGDGKAEIIVGSTVFNHDGTLRWRAEDGNGNLGGMFGHPQSIVADINLDGKPDIVAGGAAYSSTGQLMWKNSEVRDGFSAVARFVPNDPYPQIVVASWARLYLLDHLGNIIWGPVPIAGYGAPPTVADMDGDGVPEIGVAGRSHYTVYKSDGSIYWASPTFDNSAITGSTVFDFDGDGKAEVVYADEEYLRIYRGDTGQILYQAASTSGTTEELPVIADVDGDGHADLVVASNQFYAPLGTHGIRVFSDANESWVNTRKIWNQHSYHVTNINDDGSVPRVEQNSWDVHNTYRLNARPGVSSTATPDLTASWIRIQDRGGVQPSTFTVRIGNGGGLAVDPGVNIAFYNGQPEAGGVLLGTARTTQGLGSGEHQDIELSHAAALTGIAELVIVADDDGSGKHAITDFDLANNRASLPLTAQPGSFAIQVSTDQASYGANSLVAISASVTNTGSFDGSVNLNLAVLAADGVLVSELGTQQTASIPAGGQQTAQGNWNTGTRLEGQYRVRATLYDQQGKKSGEATTGFEISGGTHSGQISARLTTDKIIYQSGEILRLTEQISNESVNRPQENLVRQTTVYLPDGQALWTKSADIAQLLPGGFLENRHSLNLPAAVSGRYRAVLRILDSNGNELSVSETRFTAQNTAEALSGLQGTLSASSNTPSLGETLTFFPRIENTGTTDLSDLKTTLSVTETASQKVLASWPLTLNIAHGGSYQSAHGWQTGAARAQIPYLATLTANVDGQTRTLAQFAFMFMASNIPVPPKIVRLDAKQELVREGRVLVLVGCPGRTGDNENHCIRERESFIAQALGALGITHHVSTTQEDFRQAFRSGQYNLYWLSGGIGKLDDVLSKEIREAVYRGGGLLLEGLHDERNHLLDEVAGARYNGKLAGTAPLIRTEGILYPKEMALLAGSTQAASIRLQGGRQQARFDNVMRCEDCSGEIGSNAARPAVISQTYGHGRALLMAFDLMEKLRINQPAEQAWQSFMQISYAWLSPAAVATGAGGATLTGNEWVNLRTTIQNQGSGTALVINSLPDRDIRVVGATAGANWGFRPGVEWNLELPVDQSTHLDLALRVPTASGRYAFVTRISSIEGSGYRAHYRDLTTTIQVASAMEMSASGALIRELMGLELTSGTDKNAREQVINSIQTALDKIAATQYEPAIETLLDAIDKLNRITGRDTSAQRLAIDRWLQELEYAWLDATLRVKH